MYISLNSQFDSWYFGTDGNVGANQQDLVTVTLHELAHGLGISHSFTASGAVGYSSEGSQHPSIFDTLVQDGNSQYIHSMPPTSMAAALVSGSLWIRAGDTSARLYSPSTFNAGSSVSHLDDTTYVTGPEVLMRPSIPRGTSVHQLDGAVSCILGTIGWPSVSCGVTSAPTTPPPTVPAGGGDSALANDIGYEFVHRINCGGPTVSDADGNLWIGDSLFSPGGNSISPQDYVTVALPNVPDSTQYTNLWITERWTRWGSPDLSYVLPVTAPGTYRVALLFSEMWHTGVGTRVFSVEVQNTRVFANIDVLAQVGYQVPLILETTVVVTTEAAVTVRLVSHSDSQEGPAIYAMSLARSTTTPELTLAPITALTTPPTLPPNTAAPVTAAPVATSPTDVTGTTGLSFVHRINCGGPSVLDAEGNTWQSDSVYTPGGDFIRPDQYVPVNLADVPASSLYGSLWETERWVRGINSLEYTLTITEPGTYRLRMLFIEMWHASVGTRVFSVEVQGVAEIIALDVFATVGIQTPLIRDVDIVVPAAAVSNGVRVRFFAQEDVAEGPAVYGMSLARRTTPTAAPPTSAPVTPAPPTTVAPITPNPTSPTTAPPTSAPVTPAPPTTVAPITPNPTSPTSAPATFAPVTPAPPTTVAPTTPNPTTAAPTTAAPTTSSPSPATVDVVSWVELEPRGCCRTADGGPGDAGEPYPVANGLLECQNDCANDPRCTGIEWHNWEDKCEKHFSVNDFHHTSPFDQCWCIRKVVTSVPSTGAPTTSAAPTTATPTTVEPTSAPPTTAAPTTEAPTTATPTTAAPTTVAPGTATPTAPTTIAPTTAAPVTVAPTTNHPTTETPTTAAPTTTAPVTLQPTTPTPSPTAGFVEVVSYFEQEPRGCCRTADGGFGAEAPRFITTSYLSCQAACTSDPLCFGIEWHNWNNECEKHMSPDDFHHTAPNGACWCMPQRRELVAITFAPNVAPTAQPSTAAPSTAAPTTAAPTTVAPTSGQPTTAVPTTAQPTVPPVPPTSTPTTAAPTTVAPTTATPTTQTPTTATPTSEAPTTASPVPFGDVGYTELAPRGCCRTSSGTAGNQGVPFDSSLIDCTAACTANLLCTGIEYRRWESKCELHFGVDDFHHTSDDVDCMCLRQVALAPTAPTAPTPTPPPSTGAPTSGSSEISLEWQSAGTSLPNSIGEVASAVVNGKLYAFGEGNSQTFVYSISSGTWTNNEPTRPHVGDHHGVAVVGSTIFLVGGFNYPCVVTSCRGQVQKYDTGAQVWTALGSLPYTVEGSPATEYLAGHIHVCSGLFHRTASGGYAGHQGPAGSNPTDCFKLNPNTNQWSRFTSIPTGIDHAATATDGARMYVAGGRNIGRNVADVGLNLLQVYSAATNSWTTSNPMPLARGGAGGFFVHGRFFVVGGETDPYDQNDPNAVPGANVYRRLEYYTPSTGQWARGPDIPIGVHGMSPAYDAGTNRVYVAGGGIIAAASVSNHLQILGISGGAPPALSPSPTNPPSPSPTNQQACGTSAGPITTRGVPRSVSWEAGSEQIYDIRESNGLVYDGLMWVIGGFESIARADLSEGWRWHWQGRKTFSYNPVTDRWNQHRDLDRISGGLSHAGQTVADGKIFTAGGMYMHEYETWPNVFSVRDVYAYDIAADQWSDYPALPEARAGGPLVALGRRLHFFGGGRVVATTIFDLDYTDHWYLNLDNPQAGWTRLASLNHGRNHMGGLEHGGKIYAIGGQLLEDEYHSNVAYVEVYDPCTDSWTDLAPLPEARGHIQQSVFSTPEGIFVAGGTENFPRRHDASLLFFQPDRNTWTRLDAKPIGGASQISGIVDTGRSDGSVKILMQYHNASWIGSVRW